MMTFADLIKLLKAFPPDDDVFGIIGIGDAEQGLTIKYSSGHVLPDWDEFLKNKGITSEVEEVIT